MTTTDRNNKNPIDYNKHYPWLTNDFFEDLLRKTNDKNVKILNIELCPALKKGENFSSEMIRVKILYKTFAMVDKNNDMSLILKAEIINPDAAKTLDEADLMVKEIVIYQDVLPMVYNILSNHGVTTKFSPRFYDAQTKPSYLIFEDLSTIGFKNVDRINGLDFIHLKIVLSQLAKWHSATAVLGTNNPNVWKKCLTDPILSESTSGFYPLFWNSIRMCADIVVTWPGYEKIGEKLYKLKESVIEKVANVFTTNIDDFNVLTHGDLWVNNIMFKYNEEDADDNPVDAIMVDFSTSYWGSPAIDLTYLLYTSSNECVQEKEWNQLIEHYCKELQMYLTQMNYTKKIPTLNDIENGIRTKNIYSVVLSMMLVGLRQYDDPTEIAHISAILGTTEDDLKFQKSLVSQNRYRNNMQYLLSYYDRNGWLNS